MAMLKVLEKNITLKTLKLHFNSVFSSAKWKETQQNSIQARKDLAKQAKTAIAASIQCFLEQNKTLEYLQLQVSTNHMWEKYILLFNTHFLLPTSS